LESSVDYDSQEYQDYLAAKRAERKARIAVEEELPPAEVGSELPEPPLTSTPISQIIMPITSLSRIKDSGGSGV
jgi:hypothetical protein